MERKVLFDLPLVKWEKDSLTGLVTWRVRHYRFDWDGEYLFLGGLIGRQCLSRTLLLELAIMLSLGFIAGRELPFLPNESIEVIGG